MSTRDSRDEPHTKPEDRKAAEPSNPFGKKSVRQPETGTRLSALEIHENIRGPAVEELERPASSLLFSSLAAGMLIGFTFPPHAFLAASAPPPRLSSRTTLPSPTSTLSHRWRTPSDSYS